MAEATKKRTLVTAADRERINQAAREDISSESEQYCSLYFSEKV
jgi:hypothetical protein